MRLLPTSPLFKSISWAQSYVSSDSMRCAAESDEVVRLTYDLSMRDFSYKLSLYLFLSSSLHSLRLHTTCTRCTYLLTESPKKSKELFGFMVNVQTYCAENVVRLCAALALCWEILMRVQNALLSLECSETLAAFQINILQF